MNLCSLPNDLLEIIVKQLDRYIVISIWKVNKYFYEFYKSDHYLNMLTMAINKEMDLDLKKYSRSQLERIYRMGGRKYLYPGRKTCLMLDLEGNVYELDYEKGTVEKIEFLHNIIQIANCFDDTSLVLDKYETLYLREADKLNILHSGIVKIFNHQY